MSKAAGETLGAGSPDAEKRPDNWMWQNSICRPVSSSVITSSPHQRTTRNDLAFFTEAAIRSSFSFLFFFFFQRTVSVVCAFLGYFVVTKSMKKNTDFDFENISELANTLIFHRWTKFSNGETNEISQTNALRRRQSFSQTIYSCSLSNLTALFSSSSLSSFFIGLCVPPLRVIWNARISRMYEIWVWWRGMGSGVRGGSRGSAGKDA